MKTIFSNKKAGLFLRKKVRPFAPFFRYCECKYVYGYRGFELYVGDYNLHLVYHKSVAQ